MKFSRLIIFTILITCFIFLIPFRGGTSPKDDLRKEKISSNMPIVIHSDSLEFDQGKRIVVFDGKVNAKQEDMEVDCEKMTLYYMNDPLKSESSELASRIDKIVASGKVLIKKPDLGMAQAGKAVFYQNEGKVVLTGNPRVQKGSDFVVGHRIIIFVEENRSIVEGSEGKRVQATIFPKEHKDKQ